MAQSACQFSDQVILTSDNPRSEDPKKIINEMKAGLNASQMRKVLSLEDRREAIKLGVTLCSKYMSHHRGSKSISNRLLILQVCVVSTSPSLQAWVCEMEVSTRFL